MTHPFAALGLREDLVRAITELGYEQPTDIQQGAIPPLLAGRDVLGQAQTGTGKTAAFALPMLERLDLNENYVQGLVLTPTRELALQVAEAIEQYGKYGGAKIAPIYGGSSYSKQIRQLRSGAQVVVGTPGRVIDLIERRDLDLSSVRYVVLDEADRMLDLGFVDDVESILAGTGAGRQTALFSATFPEDVMRLARTYMQEPVNIRIERKTLTVENTEQRYYLVYEEDKLAALTRLMEVEDVKNALIFTRTKIGAAALAETLIARGYPVEAIHGDLAQDVRETVMRRYRQGLVTTLVATDVMARGLDIESVSHVFNYDIPYDGEDYVHRIGRTGRAGREGVAISLVTPRERHLIRNIERFTRQQIPRTTLPSREDVLAMRDTRFLSHVQHVLETEELEREREVVNQMTQVGYAIEDVAAAAMRLARHLEGVRPIADVREVVTERKDRPQRDGDYRERDRGDRGGRFDRDARPPRSRTGREAGMVRLMVDLGRSDGVNPGDVVGAIASESGIPGKSIGAIDIEGRVTFFDVREEHAEKVLRDASRINLRGQWGNVKRAPEGDLSGGDDHSRDRGPRRDYGDRPPRDRGPRRDFGNRPPRGPRRDR
ncbi:MAG: DEAD/DEAH box helicase [Chloroflexota bacterium]|nr:DEAD/DEAH box helicase [Chloroflexota bacterium]